MSWEPVGPAMLFCPADRPDRFARAAATADLVILDLEDGVAPTNRDSARQALIDAHLDPARTVVRINPAGTADHELDLALLSRRGFRTVMLAKAERGSDVARLAAVAGVRVIALVETALGVLNARELATEPATVALMWGAEDLVASLGGHSSRGPSGEYRDVARKARSEVLLAAGGYRRSAIDSVWLDLTDAEGLRAEALDAAASGFAAKGCIHPDQVEIVRAAFAPAPEDLAWAQRLLSAAEGAPGVFSFEGKMVDQPILDHARRLLQRRGHS